jgi:hypothetical protein
MRPTDHAESDHDVVAEVALADEFSASALVPDAAVGYAAVGFWKSACPKTAIPVSSMRIALSVAESANAVPAHTTATTI